MKTRSGDANLLRSIDMLGRPIVEHKRPQPPYSDEDLLSMTEQEVGMIAAEERRIANATCILKFPARKAAKAKRRVKR